MAYATEAQAVEIYGTSKIAVVCPDGAGGIDSARFAKALEITARAMNAYLLGRYALPLDTPPEYFQQLNTDLAIHLCADSSPRMTKIIEERHATAIKYLEQIAIGKIKLEIATDTTTVNQAQHSSLETSSELSVRSDARRFTRAGLKGLL